MKTLKLLFVVVLVSFVSSCKSQTTVTRYPRAGMVVKTVDSPNLVIYKKSPYYFSNGIWYVKRDDVYIVSLPPEGIYVTSLPSGHKIIRRRGGPYYYYNGIYYRKSGHKYIVVTL